MRQSKWFKLLMLAVAVSMVLSLFAACNDPDAGEGTTEAPGGETTEAPVNETTETPAEETTEDDSNDTTEPPVEETTEDNSNDTTEPPAEETTEGETTPANDCKHRRWKRPDTIDGAYAWVCASCGEKSTTIDGVEVYMDANMLYKVPDGWSASGDRFFSELKTDDDGTQYLNLTAPALAEDTPAADKYIHFTPWCEGDEAPEFPVTGKYLVLKYRLEVGGDQIDQSVLRIYATTKKGGIGDAAVLDAKVVEDGQWHVLAVNLSKVKDAATAFPANEDGTYTIRGLQFRLFFGNETVIADGDYMDIAYVAFIDSLDDVKSLTSDATYDYAIDAATNGVVNTADNSCAGAHAVGQTVTVTDAGTVYTYACDICGEEYSSKTVPANVNWYNDMTGAKNTNMPGKFIYDEATEQAFVRFSATELFATQGGIVYPTDGTAGITLENPGKYLVIKYRVSDFGKTGTFGLRVSSTHHWISNSDLPMEWRVNVIDLSTSADYGYTVADDGSVSASVLYLRLFYAGNSGIANVDLDVAYMAVVDDLAEAQGLLADGETYYESAIADDGNKWTVGAAFNNDGTPYVPQGDWTFDLNKFGGYYSTDNKGWVYSGPQDDAGVTFIRMNGGETGATQSVLTFVAPLVFENGAYVSGDTPEAQFTDIKLAKYFVVMYRTDKQADFKFRFKIGDGAVSDFTQAVDKQPDKWQVAVLDISGVEGYAEGETKPLQIRVSTEGCQIDIAYAAISGNMEPAKAVSMALDKYYVYGTSLENVPTEMLPNGVCVACTTAVIGKVTDEAGEIVYTYGCPACGKVAFTKTVPADINWYCDMTSAAGNLGTLTQEYDEIGKFGYVKFSSAGTGAGEALVYAGTEAFAKPGQYAVIKYRVSGGIGNLSFRLASTHHNMNKTSLPNAWRVEVIDLSASADYGYADNDGTISANPTKIRLGVYSGFTGEFDIDVAYIAIVDSLAEAAMFLADDETYFLSAIDDAAASWTLGKEYNKDGSESVLREDVNVSLTYETMGAANMTMTPGQTDGDVEYVRFEGIVNTVDDAFNKNGGIVYLAKSGTAVDNSGRYLVIKYRVPTNTTGQGLALKVATTVGTASPFSYKPDKYASLPSEWRVEVIDLMAADKEVKYDTMKNNETVYIRLVVPAVKATEAAGQTMVVDVASVALVDSLADVGEYYLKDGETFFFCGEKYADLGTEFKKSGAPAGDGSIQFSQTMSVANATAEMKTDDGEYVRFASSTTDHANFAKNGNSIEIVKGGTAVASTGKYLVVRYRVVSNTVNRNLTLKFSTNGTPQSFFLNKTVANQPSEWRTEVIDLSVNTEWDVNLVGGTVRIRLMIPGGAEGDTGEAIFDVSKVALVSDMADVAQHIADGETYFVSDWQTAGTEYNKDGTPVA